LFFKEIQIIYAFLVVDDVGKDWIVKIKCDEDGPLINKVMVIGKHAENK
jgi:hypothetical protein